MKTFALQRKTAPTRALNCGAIVNVPTAVEESRHLLQIGATFSIIFPPTNP